MGTVPAAKINKIEEKEEEKSLEHDDNCERDNLVTFLVQIEKMNSGVEKIEENYQKIKETQKHFFDEPSTAGREMYQAEHKSLMKENKRLGSWLQTNLKEEEEKLSNEDKLNQQGLLELHIKAVQLSAGKQYLINIWTNYSRLEVKFRERMKTELIKSIAITDSSLGEEEIEEKLEQGDLTALPTSILQETSGMVELMSNENKKKKFGLKTFSSKSGKEDPAVAAKQLESLEKRHEDMVRLEQEITEIHAVFMDLATMVSQKGDQLNRMEDHVNALVIKMEQTKEKIKEVDADQSWSKKRRKKFILVVLVALLLIFIIIGASYGGESDSSKCKVDSTQLDPGECLCDHFLCGDGFTCVPQNKLCDGIADCPLSETSQGGEDEEYSSCWDEGSGSGFVFLNEGS